MIDEVHWLIEGWGYTQTHCLHLRQRERETREKKMERDELNKWKEEEGESHLRISSLSPSLSSPPPYKMNTRPTWLTDTLVYQNLTPSIVISLSLVCSLSLALSPFLSFSPSLSPTHIFVSLSCSSSPSFSLSPPVILILSLTLSMSVLPPYYRSPSCHPLSSSLSLSLILLSSLIPSPLTFCVP